MELDWIISPWWYSLLVHVLMGMGTRLARARLLALLEVCKRPWSFRGSRGHAPMGANGWVCSLLYAVCQMLPLLHCTVTANGTAAHNRGKSSRGGSPRGHKARPLTQSSNLGL